MFIMQLETPPPWLKNSYKCYYIGHGRFLPNNHTFRKDEKAFNGCREVRSKPELLSRVEVLQQVEAIETVYIIQDVLGKREREQGKITGQK